MLKYLAKLEHIIGNNAYHLICDPNSPINEIKDALFQFLKYVMQIEDQIKANQAQQNPVEPEKKEEYQPKEEVSDVQH